MPTLGPISRRKVIACLRELGFTGPDTGGRHEYMLRGDRRLVIPNPHQGDISRPFLQRLLKEAGVTREEWERLR